MTMLQRNRGIDFRDFLEKYGKAVWVALVCVFAIFETAGLSRLMTNAPSINDAAANVVSAYNLAYHGVISASDDAKANLTPTNYREPLPIFFLAAHIRFHPTLSSGHTVKTINEGKASRALKQHNLFWAFLVLAGVGLTCFAAVASIAVAGPAALFAMYVVQILFLQDAGVMDMMMTEVQAAALLAWIAFTFVQAIKTGRVFLFAVCGALVGALALSKGIFYFVGPVFIIVLFLLHFIFRGKWPQRRVVIFFSVMFAAMAIVVLPWMVRNRVKLGVFEITQRSGVVMMIRAYKDQMNGLEYKGAFWYYAPALLKKGRLALFKDLHFTMKDIHEGGRLQRLNRNADATFAARDLAAELAGRPDKAISFYRAGRAERVRFENHFRKAGATNPQNLADSAMRRKAMRIFAADPFRHLKVSALFLWRGMWCFKEGPLKGSALFMLNALSLLAMWGMAIVGVFRRHPIMLGVGFLPLGAMAFMALTTHFIPRYSSMLIPNMLMAFVIAAAWGVTGLWRAWRRIF